jgi:transposase
VNKTPSDEVSAAVLDAVVSMAVAEDGSVVRTELEQTAIRRESFANLAWARYQAEHPQVISNGSDQYDAVSEGLRLLAVETISWLVEHQHLAEIDEDRVRLGPKPLLTHAVGATDKKRQPYVPGTNREADLFAGVRRVTEARKELILQSIAELGDLREFFPVLEDDAGNIVDGRHRRAIDPDWPASRVRVPQDQRVAVATAANRSNAWTKKDWDDMLAYRKHVVGERQAKRVLARLALLEDHERSNRVISDLTGANQHVVAEIRAELEDIALIAQYRGSAGKPRKDGTPAQSQKPPPNKIADAKVARINAAFGSGSTEAEVAAKFGISKSTANKYKNMWKKDHQPAPPPVPTEEQVVLPEPESEIEPVDEATLDVVALRIFREFSQGVTVADFRELVERHDAGERISDIGFDCLTSLAESLHKFSDLIAGWIADQR